MDLDVFQKFYEELCAVLINSEKTRRILPCEFYSKRIFDETTLDKTHDSEEDHTCALLVLDAIKEHMVNGTCRIDDIYDVFRRENPLKEIADKMKDFEVKISRDALAAHQNAQNEARSTSPNPIVKKLVKRINSIPELHQVTYELKEKFNKLLLSVKTSLVNTNVSNIKLIILNELTNANCTSESTTYKNSINAFKELDEINEIIEFLVNNHFIGYLNYTLLKALSDNFANRQVKSKFAKYEKDYEKLMNQATLDCLREVFEEYPDVSPSTAIGMPLIMFKLEGTWPQRSYSNWRDYMRNKFSWFTRSSHLNRLSAKCILVSIAVFPCCYQEILQELSKPDITEMLQADNITVQFGSGEVTTLLIGNENDLDEATPTSDPNVAAVQPSESRPSSDDHVAPQLTKSQQLYTAVLNSDISQIVQLVQKEKVDMNVKFQPNVCQLGNSETLLQLAVESGKLSVVNVLISLGANVNVFNQKGKAALYYAIRYNYTEIATTLIENGAIVDKDGRQYLHYLVQQQMIAHVKEFLSSGDFNHQKDMTDEFGNTPLHLAIKSDCNDIIEVLLEYGANVEVCDKSGLSPIYLAALEGNKSAVEKLMEHGAEVNLVDEHKQTYLHIATSNEHFTAVEMFLTFIKDKLDSVDKNSKTPLHLAAEKGFDNIAELLLSNGANPNLLDIFEKAPLHYAAESGHFYLVENLLKYKAEVDLLNQEEMTPLSLAAGGNHLDIVKTLLSHKADVNSVDNSGWSPLTHAAWNGCYEIVVELVSKGADVNIEDENGMGALRHAVGKGHADVTRTLMENGAKVNVMDDGEWSLLHEAAHKNHIDVARVLLEKGFNVDIQDDDKWSAFNEALIHAFSDMVHLMLEFGANTTYREEHDGKTSIHHAVDSRHKPDRYKVIEMLLEHPEVDPNATDDSGKTPLHYAVQRNYPDIVQLLLDHGADMKIENEAGETPVELAETNNCEEIMKIFEQSS